MSPSRAKRRELELDDAELARVREAVRRAEQRTAGEIVTYVVGACDDYPEATWRAAVIGGLVGLLAAAGAHDLIGAWGGPLSLWAALPATGGAALAAALARVPAIRRSLVSPEDLDRRVGARAEAAFLEEEVFATRGRSGILLFLALFEHRAIVLGDAGINRAVEPERWKTIVEGLVSGIREGRAVDALVHAVEACGRLLEEHGVELEPGDVDELSNVPRVRDE